MSLRLIADELVGRADCLRVRNGGIVTDAAIDAYKVVADALEEVGDKASTKVMRSYTDALQRILNAMWNAETGWLEEHHPCRCCCVDHTAESCPARTWGACLGQGERDSEYEDWAVHYARFHGMPRERFDGREETAR